MTITKLFQDIERSKVPVRVYGSLIEVYNENVYDLLSADENVQQEYTIRENNRGQFIIPNLTKIKLQTLEEAQAILLQGNKRKTFGNSNLHNRSSRSHTIFRLYLAKLSKTTTKPSSSSKESRVLLSEFNIVDLAGSELLSNEFGQQQQDETKHINLSLLFLKRVIQSLSNENAHIPYRQSSLTKILQNSLGGNSLTSILCMVSPCKEHGNDSQRTLSFGKVAQKISIKIEPQKNSQKTCSFNDKADLKCNVNLPFSEVKCIVNKKYAEDSSLSDIQDEIQIVKTAIGKISVHYISKTTTILGADDNEKDHVKPIVAILHAHSPGCGGLDWNYLFKPLLNAGFCVIAPDFPGFEESSHLPRVSSRTEDHAKNNDKSSPVYLLDQIFSYYDKNNTRKRILIGYDWGGGLAASYALQFPKKAFRVIMFHPSWTLPLAPLNKLKTRTLILWVPVEQLHVYSRGVKMAKAIPNCTFVKCTIGAYSNSKSCGYYHPIGNTITQLILDWLPKLKAPRSRTTRPIQEKQKKQIEEHTTHSVNDNDVDDDDDFHMDESILDKEIEEMIDASDYLPDLHEKRKNIEKLKQEDKKLNSQKNEEKESLSTIIINEKDDTVLWAVKSFKTIYDIGELDKWYHAYISCAKERSSAVKLFASLPDFDPRNISIQNMVQCQIWPEKVLTMLENKNLSNCLRYKKGRQVLVKVPVYPSIFDDENYLAFNADSSHELITYRAFIYEIFDDSFMVAIEKAQNQSQQQFDDSKPNNYEFVNIPKEHIYLLNEPTNFKIETEGYLFEDKIHCKYSDVITKAKLMEVCRKIENEILFFDMKKNESVNEFTNFQKKCIDIIWESINLTHFDHVGLHPSRYSKPSVGRLAHFGQGNCHTLASVLAAFLLPFGKLFGWEVTFKAGFFYKPNGRDANGFNGIPRSISDHTWLEVTLLPSLERLVCDPSFDEICIPLHDAYCATGHRHPSGNIECQALQPRIMIQ